MNNSPAVGDYVWLYPNGKRGQNKNTRVLCVVVRVEVEWEFFTLLIPGLSVNESLAKINKVRNSEFNKWPDLNFPFEIINRTVCFLEPHEVVEYVLGDKNE